MTRKTLVVLGLVALFELAVALPMVAGGDLTTDLGEAAQVVPILDPLSLAQRYLPRDPGVEKDMTLFFGPFVIPPGADMNRIQVDVPLHDGFITAIAPNLRDAVTGQVPHMIDVHIHHAHWFRVSDDPNEEYYTLNLAWVFGTGEERTQGSLNDRAAAQPGGPQYGIFIPGQQPQVLIFMIHNKGQGVLNLYITLDVSFVYGTAGEIAAAQGCGPLAPDERCRAGETFHALNGKLWGSTFDVPRQADGDGIYVYPNDAPGGSALGRWYTSPADGTAVATAGHLHPLGTEVVIANLGPAESGCEADLDGDGWPGVTLLRSSKMERNPLAFPTSEDYQMGVSKAGWRAPVHAGDRISQFGVYANKDYAAYQAMSYVGFYVDRQQPPPPLGPEGCTADSLRPWLVDDPLGQATQSMLNHPWDDHVMELCGLPGYLECDRPVVQRTDGLETPVVAIADFAYVPGDRTLVGQLGAPPKVHVGQSLTFINGDTGLGGVRHTVTSCNWPCNGPYVANYPQPNGLFDSGKLGNLDYIDGGITGSDTVPVWHSPTDLAPGLYSYYCRIHPRMRGVFEVVE
jgi:plastocyanin